jgi:hypothetical protein
MFNQPILQTKQLEPKLDKDCAMILCDIEKVAITYTIFHDTTKDELSGYYRFFLEFQTFTKYQIFQKDSIFIKCPIKQGEDFQ